MKRARQEDDGDENEEEEEEDPSPFPQDILDYILSHMKWSDLLLSWALTNKTTLKMQYMWKEMYQLRFGEHPYWFKNGIKNNMEDPSLWKAYKNIYTWTAYVTDNVIRIDTGSRFIMQIIELVGSEDDPVEEDSVWTFGRISMPYKDRKPDKLRIVSHKKTDNNVHRVTIGSIPFEYKPTSFFIGYRLENETIEFDIMSALLEYNLTESPPLLSINDRHFKHTYPNDEVPQFLENIGFETVLNWDDTKKTLEIKSYPHLRTMIMSSFIDKPSVLITFLTRVFGLNKKLVLPESVAADLHKSILFVFLLFINDSEDIGFIQRYAGLDSMTLEEKYITLDRWIRDIFLDFSPDRLKTPPIL